MTPQRPHCLTHSRHYRWQSSSCRATYVHSHNVVSCERKLNVCTDTSQALSDTSSFVRLTAVDTSIAVDAAIRLSDTSQETNIYSSIQRAARTHGRHDFYALTQAREAFIPAPSRTHTISILPYVLFSSFHDTPSSILCSLRTTLLLIQLSSLWTLQTF